MTPKELEAKVAMMRKLGVLECDGLKLGPAPAPPVRELTSDEIRAKQDAEEERQRDIMFAHSSVKPLLRSVKR